MKDTYIYIMTNQRNTTLYIGVTSNLVRRVYEHKNKQDKKSFTARYNLNKIVYYEHFNDPYPAIEREKQLKPGNRKQKVDLINGMNPEWQDLYEELKEW